MISYITYGKQTFRRHEGVAADFCVICRRPTGIDVQQLRLQNHVNHIGIGQGELVGRICHCTVCGSEWSLQPQTITGTINPAGPMPLSSVIAETYPTLAAVNQERLKQEEIIKRDPHSLDAPTRANLIAEPFFVLENDLLRDQAKRYSSANLVTGLGCLTGVGFIIAGLVGFFAGGFVAGLIPLFVAFGLIWGTLTMSAAIGRRYMRDTVYPRLASCLAPLEPSAAELAAVIGQIRVNSKCAARTQVDIFDPILRQAQATLAQARRAV